MPHLHTVRLSYCSYIYPLRWTPSNFVEELPRKTMRSMAEEMIFLMFSFIAHKFQPHLPSCVLKTLSWWSRLSCKSIVVAEGGGRFYLGHHHHCELCGLPSCYVWLAILSHIAAAIRQNQAATSIYLFIYLSVCVCVSRCFICLLSGHHKRMAYGISELGCPGWGQLLPPHQRHAGLQLVMHDEKRQDKDLAEESTIDRPWLT